jgi:putative transposase
MLWCLYQLAYGETYIKLKGQWGRLYRAVDKHDDTIAFMLSETCTEKDA